MRCAQQANRSRSGRGSTDTNLLSAVVASTQNALRRAKKRGVEVRVAKSQSKRDKALQMLADGFNIKQAAGFAEFDRKTVERWKVQSERIPPKPPQAVVLGAEVALAI